MSTFAADCKRIASLAGQLLDRLEPHCPTPLVTHEPPPRDFQPLDSLARHKSTFQYELATRGCSASAAAHFIKIHDCALTKIATDAESRFASTLHGLDRIPPRPGVAPLNEIEFALRTRYMRIFQEEILAIEDDILREVDASRAFLEGSVEDSKGGFTNEAKAVLKAAYDQSTLLTSAEKRALAAALGLEYKQVQTWFANQRARRPAPYTKSRPNPPRKTSLRNVSNSSTNSSSSVASTSSSLISYDSALSDDIIVPLLPTFSHLTLPSVHNAYPDSDNSGGSSPSGQSDDLYVEAYADEGFTDAFQSYLSSCGSVTAYSTAGDESIEFPSPPPSEFARSDFDFSAHVDSSFAHPSFQQTLYTPRDDEDPRMAARGYFYTPSPGEIDAAEQNAAMFAPAPHLRGLDFATAYTWADDALAGFALGGMGAGGLTIPLGREDEMVEEGVKVEGEGDAEMELGAFGM